MYLEFHEKNWVLSEILNLEILFKDKKNLKVEKNETIGTSLITTYVCLSSKVWQLIKIVLSTTLLIHKISYFYLSAYVERREMVNMDGHGY